MCIWHVADAILTGCVTNASDWAHPPGTVPIPAGLAPIVIDGASLRCGGEGRHASLQFIGRAESVQRACARQLLESVIEREGAITICQAVAILHWFAFSRAETCVMFHV